MNRLPQHIGIIMDGNGRWAKQRNLPRLSGHRAGADAVERVMKTCVKHKIKFLTLFAFSLENQKRPKQEVTGLMSLLGSSLKKHTHKLHDEGVRLKTIGDRSLLGEKLRGDLEKTEELTKENSVLTIILALHYSGRWDIVQAAKKLAKEVKDGAISLANINENTFQRYLSTASYPEPDLLIRTSGEERISNFMLWESAYTELYFSKVLWPDFDENEFEQALAVFQDRERRFGSIG